MIHTCVYSPPAHIVPPHTVNPRESEMEQWVLSQPRALPVLVLLVEIGHDGQQAADEGVAGG